MRTVGERRNGGRNRNNDGMSLKTRGGRERAGGNRNADGVRIGKRGKNADGTSKRRNNNDIGDGDDPAGNGIKMRGGGRGEGKTVRGGNGKNRSKTPRGGKNIGGELPGNSKIKTRNGESMASAVIKAGITLVPIESSTAKNGKRKRGN